MNVVRMAMRGRSKEETRDWVSTEMRKLHCHLSDLLSLQNSALPLHNFPAEVLADILRRACTGQTSVAWLIKTAGVCRHWKDIIVGTPLLWNDIDLAMPERHTALSLVRSQEASLRIHAHTGRLAVVNALPVCSLLIPHHARISQVDLTHTNRLPSRDEPLRHMVEASLPALTSLTINTYTEFTLQLTGSHLPNIRRLSLEGAITLQWDADWPLPDLTYLRLVNVTHSRHGSGDQQARGDVGCMLDVLEACSSLETFRYRQARSGSASPSGPGWSSISDQRMVTLSCARDFFVDTASVDGAAAILARVALPRKALTSVHVSGNIEFETGAPLNASLLRAVLPSNAAHLPVIVHARHITVWLVEAGLLVWVDEDWRIWGATVDSESSEDGEEPEFPVLSLCFSPPKRSAEAEVFHGIVLELGSIFPSSVESLILNGPIHFFDNESWHRVLAAFPFLQYLELYSTLTGLKDFIAVLKPDTHSVPWACLQELVLEYSPPRMERDTGSDVPADLEILRELRAVLQERSEADSRLEHLSIDLRHSPADVEEIKLELSSLVGSLDLNLL